MKKNNKIILLLFFILYNSHKNWGFIIKPSNGETNFQTWAINTVPNPPKIYESINWEKKFLPPMQKFIEASINLINEKNDNTLLINTIENISNHNLNIKKTTYNLIKLLNELENKFSIVNSNISAQTYKNLKLFNKNLTSCSQAIKLARHTNTKYVLCNTIYNDLKEIKLKTNLISTQNGEIMWSDTSSLLIQKNDFLCLNPS